MSSVSTIRSHFLSYFERHGHTIMPSSPLVPRNDPTLMFTNAGMVQFKDYFTGRALPAVPRATTSQKCVRAGGKHNDLDNVGYTARHHTFFEMLGNFSFGDYFKEQAIELAWNLVTGEFGIPSDRLCVTVYHEDEEAFGLWRKIARLPESRIIRIAASDNFWAMGDTGPCGPCSEIFYDHGEDIAGGPPGSAEADGDRFIEIWNLVFMQFEQLPGGKREALPKPSIDTGMGLERVAAVLQGVHDNYDIDLFRSLIAASVEATGVRAEGAERASHRVIADHLRATSFLIADGVLPSNEGRGYVLRRIMRRAMRHAHILGAKDPLIWRLVPVLVHEMGQAYPELVRAEPLIAETLKLEETRFKRTLERGTLLLDQEAVSTTDASVNNLIALDWPSLKTRIEAAPEDIRLRLATLDEGAAKIELRNSPIAANAISNATLSGDKAFQLYDTYGFPLDLTQDALRPLGIRVDNAGFQAAMERQKAEARAAWAGSGEAQTEPVWFQLRDRLGATEFLGYASEEAEGRVLALVRAGKEIESASAGEEVAVIVNQTPFYAESGGQLADAGTIVSDHARLRVDDVQKRADGLFVHLAKVESGKLAIGDAVRLEIDVARRARIRSNHSATHLLHAALRSVLGPHVAQKGSMVAPDRLRFDFSHPKPVIEGEVERVEDIANRIILQDAPVETRLMDRDGAIASGAMALFGEKYGDEVRVVTMGTDNAAVPPHSYSVELCGGTHVGRTGEIGLVTVVSESAVAAGVRRIEALTGEAARHHLENQEKHLRSIASALRVRPDEAAERVAALIEERRKLDRELAEARKKLALGGGGAAPADDIREIGSVRYLGRTLMGINPRDLKGIADDGKKAVGSGVVAVIGIGEDGKAGLVVGVTEDLVARISAVDLVRAGSEVLGGRGGGGRPDMAQAGGPDGTKAVEALAAIEAAIRERA